MKQKADRYEIARRAVGAILASGLSSREIEVLASDLMNDSSFSFQLGQVLKSNLKMLVSDPVKSPAGLALDDPNWLTLAIERVNKKGISKKTLAKLISDWRLLNVSASALQRLTVREMLYRVLENTSPAEFNEFLNNISQKVEADPYLTGIERR